MKTLTESIIGRRGSGIVPILLKKIKNPNYSDMISWNIIKINYTNIGHSLYGIIIPGECGKKIYGIDGYVPYIVFYNPKILTAEASFVCIEEYSKTFPNPDWTSSGNYVITDIWNGSEYESYFEERFQNKNDIKEFLRPAYENPKEFERMLQK